MNRLRKSTILWLQGGLGNQLFQWNAAIHVSRSAKAPLIISTASFRRDRLRDFELKGLDDSIALSSGWENRLIGPPHHRFGAVRKRAGVLNLRVREDLEGPCVPGELLVGFFQDAPSLMLSTEPVRAALVKRRRELCSSTVANVIKDRPVVHVRRGDYATSEAALKTFGTLRPDYYREALEDLGEKMTDVVFFTDDPEYVINTFCVRDEQVFGPQRTTSSVESLLLMSLGRSLIIPNSTFSWWAAEIMDPDRPVVSPQEWFRDDRDGLHLARSHWKRISN